MADLRLHSSPPPSWCSVAGAAVPVRANVGRRADSSSSAGVRSLTGCHDISSQQPRSALPALLLGLLFEVLHKLIRAARVQRPALVIHRRKGSGESVAAVQVAASFFGERGIGGQVFLPQANVLAQMPGGARVDDVAQ